MFKVDDGKVSRLESPYSRGGNYNVRMEDEN
jgi:hypothetical protein